MAIAGYVFRDQVSKGNKGNLSQVALGIWGLKSVLNNTRLYSQVKSEFNKSFQQQMQNYLKDNKTATILDKLQKEVSGTAGKRGLAGVEDSHL